MSTRYSAVNERAVLNCKVALTLIAFNTLLIVVTVYLTFSLVDDIEKYKLIWYHKGLAVNTTCTIEKYNATKKKCHGSRKYITKDCYDKRFEVTYQIFNGSRITGVIETKNASSQTSKEVRTRGLPERPCILAHQRR